MIAVSVANRISIEMAVNPGVPRSSISAATRHRLIMEEIVPPREERTYILSNVQIEGQPVPPLHVRVSAVLRRVGVGGIVGLDFLGQYEDIHFHVPTFRLTLNGS
jgi:ribosomal protein S19E (S16A)